MQDLPVSTHCDFTSSSPPQPPGGKFESQNWAHSAATKLGQSDAQTGAGESDNLQETAPAGLANMQRHCGWRSEGGGGGPHPQLPSASVVQICPWSGQKSSLQANRGFPGPPQWWSTHVQRPPSVPDTNSQKGNSRGHGPPHVAVPALGSPLTNPHSIGGATQPPAALHVSPAGQQIPPHNPVPLPSGPQTWQGPAPCAAALMHCPRARPGGKLATHQRAQAELPCARAVPEERVAATAITPTKRHSRAGRH